MIIESPQMPRDKFKFRWKQEQRLKEIKENKKTLMV